VGKAESENHESGNFRFIPRLIRAKPCGKFSFLFSAFRASSFVRNIPRDQDIGAGFLHIQAINAQPFAHPLYPQRIDHDAAVAAEYLGRIKNHYFVHRPLPER
jgi:hypothetical protein